MKNSRIIAVTLLALLLAACNGQAPDADTAKAKADTAMSDTGGTQSSSRLSASQLAEIPASGKTGLWTDEPLLCAGRAKGQATLAWNVTASGVKKVNLYLLGRDGKERRFASGGAIGGKRTGHWLTPGTTFILRAANDTHELSRVVFGKKQC